MQNAIVEQEKENVKLFGVTETICCQVSEYKGKTRIDTRRWFKGTDGKFYRSNKGISLTIDEWNTLMTKVDEIAIFVEKQLG